jgi:hypothetical protein
MSGAGDGAMGRRGDPFNPGIDALVVALRAFNVGSRTVWGRFMFAGLRPSYPFGETHVSYNGGEILGSGERRAS